MTEAEWLACDDPIPMLAFVRGKPSDRKLRLFACACCRHYAPFGEDRGLQEAVALAERHADGVLPEAEYPRYNTFQHHSLMTGVMTGVASGISQTPPGSGWLAAYRCALNAARGSSPEAAAQCCLLRCVIGNPYPRSPPLPAVVLAWNEGTAVRLARAIYEDRAFDNLPVLADALEDAGCSDPGLLAHCRQVGEHVRGCWAVDLLLGKE